MDDRSDIARAAAEAAARQSYGKLVAWLAARTRDVAGAEDALADAFAAALERWPRTGVPAQPEAWLLAVARRRDVDAVRRRLTSEAARDHLKLISEEIEARMSSEELPDERLRLMFACAHPAIESSVRAPLILQTILGFDAAAIASAFLVSPATMGQRLVRAKNRIRETGIPFRVPEQAELGERLGAVLEAIYASFAEGWSDPSGTETRRRNLATEGIWLGRLVASLMPEEPEALGLLALMLFAEARRAARRSPEGDFVALADQDTALWDDGLIDEAEALLGRAARKGVIGRYQLEAAVQSAHTARRRGGRTDWAAIRQLYDALMTVAGSPVVAINRAVAIAEEEGTPAGLSALYVLGEDKRLQDYQPYWAARAGLLARLGTITKAAEAYDRAIGLERDDAVRRFLQAEKAKLVRN
ncbi:RNA polymerase sigma factor [Mesorhizobium sp. CU2]|uniref:RNA polymerase sigma factor n=1 Tax=unclassified Mesorhizobium TaxID=325217 RepID=UPI00112E2721|nr:MULTISPECIES: RNA polymerase sigma factor [unclassified Mesorhizobium]TPN83557.1 RNA polymerase sigma factor [Mesorhizobium sp. CU3]TPO14139.1 RNA polymerase sigma factor [Mesorhizobium sp. CU2]